MGAFALCWTTLLVAPQVAWCQFGTIQIRWDADGSVDGLSTPTVVTADDENGDDAAEVSQYRSEDDAYEDAWWRGGFAEDTKAEWFAASPAVRHERPASVEYGVGTVYRHSTSGALGVVVGWDSRTRAPRAWTAYNAGQLGVTLQRLHAPHYSVLEELTEDDDSLRFMTRYIIGDWMQALRRDTAPLKHPQLDHFFSGYDRASGRYVPRPWLQERYPHG